MSDKNNIDDLFRENLAHYTEEPPDGIWDAIAEKQHSKAIPWWRKLPKMFVLIGLLLVVCIVAVSFFVSVFKQQQFRKEMRKNEAQNLSIGELIEIKSDDVKIKPESIADNTTPQVVEKEANGLFPSRVSDRNSAPLPIHELLNTGITTDDWMEDNSNTYIPDLYNENPPADMALTQMLGNGTSLNEAMLSENEAPRETLATASHLVHTTELFNKPYDSVFDISGIRKKEYDFFLSVYGFPAYTTSVFEAGDLMAANYTSWRNDAEKAIIVINHGLSLGLNANRFFVRTGLSYAKHGEQNVYDFNIVSSIDTAGGYYEPYTYTIPDPNNSNNTIVVFDSLWKSVYDTAFSNIVNNHRSTYAYFCIPLELGFNVIQNEKSRLGLTVGFSYMMLHRQKAQMLNQTADGFILSENVDTHLKRNVSAYSLSLIYTRILNDYVSLFVEPKYLQTSGTVFKDSFDVSQSYRQLGLKIGLNIHFK